MRIKLLIISFLIFIIHLTLPDNCHSIGEGGMPGYFLELGAGARALGMGRAFVALADDSSAIYWNPAGLCQGEKKEISGMHIILFEDTRYEFIGYIQPIAQFWSMGIGGIQLATGGAIKRDEYKNSGGEFSDYNNALFLTNSFQITQNILFGFSAKCINKYFDTINDTIYVADIGILIKPVKIINLGLNIQNWLSSSSGSICPEMITRPGIALKLFKEKYIVTGDLEFCKGRSLKMHLGAEVNLSSLFSIRTGYDNNNLTLGGGLKYRNYRVDYAFLNHEMGPSQRVSINVKFGKTLDEVKEEKIKIKMRGERIEKNLAAGANFYYYKKWRKALEKYSEVLKDDKNNEDAMEKSKKLNETLKDIAGHKAAAIGYRISDKLDDAIKEWGKIFILESKDDIVNDKEEITKLYNRIAELKLKNNDSETAVIYWNKTLSLDPKNEEATMGIKKIEETKENERQKQIASHVKEAGTYFNSKNWESALAEWREVLKIDPENNLAKGGLEKIEEEKVKETEKVINSHIENAKKYLDNKEWESSIEEWNKVLEISTSNVTATEGLKKVEETRKIEMEKDKERIRTIAVIDFTALSVASSDAVFMTEFFRQDLISSGIFTVVEKNNMDKILSEQGFQQSGCTDVDCAVKMGKILNVHSMVIGNFGKLVDTYRLTIRIVEVETGKAIYADEASCGVGDDLREMSKNIISRLVDKMK